LKSITHPASVAFGLANLYLLDLTGPIISPGHDLVYHLVGSASSVIVPVILYVLALWVVLTCFLLFTRRPGPWRVILLSGLLLAIPPTLLRLYTDFSGARTPSWPTGLVSLSCLFAFVVISLLWKRSIHTVDAIEPLVETMVGFLAVIGLVVFVQLLWNGWQARHLNRSAALHQARLAPASPPHRVIWLILDELSYEQVYERRFPGLDLPAFDQLAAQSTVFTHAIPTGEHTSYIVPTLFTGTPANAVSISASGFLLGLKDPASGRWTSFDQHQTVFQDALNAGYSTGITGWYNPYCRILPAVLDHCFWTYSEATPANLSPNRSIAAGLVRPFRSLRRGVQRLFGYGVAAPTAEVRDLRQHSADYNALLAAGDDYLHDPSIDFLFLHMPMPHPYGFYDRKTRSIATHHTSYIDNLALADAYLAHLRQILEQQHQWDGTTLVVMGDHSWRTSLLWASSEGWTAEDNAASRGGRFDDRPAVIVKLPNQQTPARIDQPWNAVETRAMMDVLLERRVRSPEDLQAWVLRKR
jgi:Sulfatase